MNTSPNASRSSATTAEVANGGSGGADEETLAVVLAAVNAVLRGRTQAAATAAASNRNRSWRFSGRNWDTGPRRRARP